MRDGPSHAIPAELIGSFVKTTPISWERGIIEMLVDHAQHFSSKGSIGGSSQLYC